MCSFKKKNTRKNVIKVGRAESGANVQIGDNTYVINVYEESRRKTNEPIDKVDYCNNSGSHDPSPAADIEPKPKPKYDGNGCCPRCGSYHSFDIYKRGEEGEDPYYICAVCGRKDNDDEDKRKIIKDDKSINPELHVLASSVLDDVMNENDIPSLKRVLVKNNIQKIGTSQGGSAINKYYGGLEIFSLSIPDEKGEPYYTLGKGLFDFSNNQKWIKLYGMKYVKTIEEGCFKGVDKEERETFWEEYGFTLNRKDEYFC